MMVGLEIQIRYVSYFKFRKRNKSTLVINAE